MPDAEITGPRGDRLRDRAAAIIDMKHRRGGKFRQHDPQTGFAAGIPPGNFKRKKIPGRIDNRQIRMLR